MLLSPHLSWSRVIVWARVALATVALAASYFFPPSGLAPLVYAIFGVYLAYSVMVALRGKVHTGMAGLLGIFGDTVYFLIIASYGGEHLLWVASFFFLYILGETLIFYSTVEVMVIVAVSVVFCAVLPYALVLERTVVAAGALGCAFAVHKRRQAATIEALEAKVKEAERAAEKATEVERARIASDFHDGPLQSFMSLQMRLEILRKVMDRDLTAGMADLKQLQALAHSQVRDLRTFLRSMQPADLDGANLMASIRRAAASFQKESGIPVTFIGTDSPVGLAQEATQEVLQMLREALHNVQKHSGATRVAVALERTDRGLEISIDDNGRGFEFSGSYSLEELELLRLGPASLKRRARSLNADLVLESRPQRGAGVKFRIPLQ